MRVLLLNKFCTGVGLHHLISRVRNDDSACVHVRMRFGVEYLGNR